MSLFCVQPRFYARASLNVCMPQRISLLSKQAKEIRAGKKESYIVAKQKRYFLTSNTHGRYIDTKSLNPNVKYHHYRKFHSSAMNNEGLFARIKKFFTKKELSPRIQMERNDLYMTLLTSVHKDLRLKLLARNEIESAKAITNLVDEATNFVENKMDADSLSLGRLRWEVQHYMEKEVIQLFKATKEVENMIPQSHFTENTEFKSDVDTFCKELLFDEIAYITEELEKITKTESTTDKVAKNEMNNSSLTDDEAFDDTLEIDETALRKKRRKRQIPFLEKKLEALQTIITFNKWKEEKDGNLEFVIESTDDADAFGYYPKNSSDEMNKAMRYHQMINMTRAKLLRTNSNLGYSLVALQSTIPSAGRGVFVDGYARAGSLIGFFPGEIWPKEYLLNMKTASLFEPDEKFQLSLRYDDILIDSRKSPYTVLDRKNSNPFAISHIVNHPPPDVIPNCRTTMINFTGSMDLKKMNLEKYVPNAYARNPMLLGAKAFEVGNEDVFMHGFALYAARDICNEEIFYDYRLSPGSNDQSLPSWYHTHNEEELKMRWHESN